jgi:hypothetical protein
MHTAKGLQFTKPESSYVTTVILAVVHDFGNGDDTAFSPAQFAQGMLPQVSAPPLAPAA